MSTPKQRLGRPATRAPRKRNGALTRLRAQIDEGLLRIVPKALCRATLETYTGNGEGVLYRLGTQHYVWVHFFGNATSRSQYRAIVTTARKVVLQASKECVLCRDADDVIAALLAEIRRLRKAGAI
ncbi:hypothetical protein KDX23_22855 [Burkholderia vietnamiensis]|uniref:hypothetical protein n=1 Tax=Burkholderia vietnamiensis TaxID=60552 RepID=UPI001B9C7B5C|nr:hypothetical protein [Burkholderia vietnamiensis]MBR8085579.1 hypothetical protein [Burkholderia vietnamiensis]